MQLSSKKKGSLAIISIILPMLTIGLAITFGYISNSSTSAPAKVNLKDFKVLQVGQGNKIYNEVLARIKTLGVSQVKSLDIQSYASEEASDVSVSQSPGLVVFDGEWLSKRTDDANVHKFLKTASGKAAKLIAVGGSTSKLLEALDKAKVNELGREDDGTLRNPAYFNPSVVGFCYKETKTPTGSVFQYPSIFISNTDNTDTMVQSLISWLGD